ncbi:hypothetical protein B0I35DRAFT_203455 [Stachybotrys elegans]|uniref:ER-bound oxygenase mpaB/mpaB'/Rubber oxygenase catalytic domain-containing protein n=1 Tax=Stachybotrys elegans TaxID=80388 RepID=A0A8K0SY57_9HYPO|nr:hypothetical protein B0I35DRAFT_203455 [Stachybotrys elegans]
MSLFSTSDNARVIWDHPFHWTGEHMGSNDLRGLLVSYDRLATDALDKLDEISPPKSKSWRCPHGSGPGQHDYFQLLQDHSERDATLTALWKEVSTVPDWVDWDQIRRGQLVVYQYCGQFLLGLLYNSLMGGMGASRVVETLGKTGGFGVNVAKRRLLETLQHFLDVVYDLDSIKPGGKGYTSSVRVRFLHASVRRRIMQLAAQKPGYFDVEENGVPINDLHCIGTIAAYSVALIHLSLPRQGISLTQQQIADYLALWRWVGYIMGTPVDWMETPERAKAMLESVMVYEIAPSPKSAILANNVLTAESYTPPLDAPRELLAAYAYRLNGSALCEALQIERPPLQFHLVVRLQLLTLMCVGYSYPWWPASLKQCFEMKFKRTLHQMISSPKLGNLHEDMKFELQYVPELDKTTELGAYEKGTSVSTASKRGWRSFLAHMVLLVCILLAVVAFLQPRLSGAMVHWAASVLPPSQVMGKLN